MPTLPCPTCGVPIHFRVTLDSPTRVIATAAEPEVSDDGQP